MQCVDESGIGDSRICGQYELEKPTESCDSRESHTLLKNAPE